MVEGFDPEEPSTASRRRVVAKPARIRVAVADDEKNLREIVASILLDEGYDVQTAPDGLVLMELVARFAPDLVVTDISMPRMDGLEVLRALRARGPRPRVVLMTAWPPWEDRRDLMGANAILYKPFDLRDLVGVVKAQSVR